MMIVICVGAKVKTVKIQFYQTQRHDVIGKCELKRSVASHQSAMNYGQLVIPLLKLLIVHFRKNVNNALQILSNCTAESYD